MKYLIATDGPELTAKLAKRFGHAAYFTIYDTQTGESKSFPGVGHDEPSHGLGRFENQGIERVLLGNVGPGAFADIKSLGWQCYLARKMNAEQAIEATESGEIKVLTEPTTKKSIHSGHGEHHH